MKKIIIVGGHEQATNILEHLSRNGIADVVLCICRQDDTGEDGLFPSLLKKSRQLDIPSLQPAKLNSQKVIESVERADADLVLSLQNNMIFGERWVKLFESKLGIVNVHYSPLPRYAGYWPEMWAIWNSEKSFAVTLHYVGIGIDTGPIIAQRFFELSEQENRKSLYDKSSSECFELLVEQIPLMLVGKLPAIEQNTSMRSYYDKSLPNEGVLDLEWDAETQKRFIRAIAFPGFPGPKIHIGESCYTVIAEDLPFFKNVSFIPK